MKNKRMQGISGAIVLVLVVLAGVFIFGQISNPSKKRPNVIFILTGECRNLETAVPDIKY